MGIRYLVRFWHLLYFVFVVFSLKWIDLDPFLHNFLSPGSISSQLFGKTFFLPSRSHQFVYSSIFLNLKRHSLTARLDQTLQKIQLVSLASTLHSIPCPFLEPSAGVHSSARNLELHSLFRDTSVSPQCRVVEVTSLCAFLISRSTAEWWWRWR